MSAIDFKAKYAPLWSHTNKRELTAIVWLWQLGIEAAPRGHGALSAEVLDGYHLGAQDKFDLEAPSHGLLFEVTGSDWSRNRSAKRYLKPVLPVLKAKVDAAIHYGLDGRLWFVAVAENQGEVRFLPCSEAKRHPITHYAAGEGPYYAVPWDNWWLPAWARREFEKRREKLARRLEA